MTHVAKRRTEDAFLDVGLTVSTVWAGRAHELESRYGQRRGTAERFHRSVDWSDPAQVDRALRAWSRLLDEPTLRGRAETQRLLAVLRGEGLVVDDAGAVRRRGAVGDAARPPAPRDPAQVLAQLDHVRSSLGEDLEPAQALVRTAELVEALTRTVLGEPDRPAGPVRPLPELVLRARRGLGVALDDGHGRGSSHAAERLLGTAGDLLTAVADMRGLRLGEGRGADRLSPDDPSSAWHARLAIDAAAAWCGALLTLSGSGRATTTAPARAGDAAVTTDDGASVTVPPSAE